MTSGASTIFDTQHRYDSNSTVAASAQATSPGIELIRAIAKIDSPIVKVGLALLVLAAAIDHVRRNP
jgi:hypothetical protein